MSPQSAYGQAVHSEGTLHRPTPATHAAPRTDAGNGGQAADTAAQDKRFATLRARAALIGCTLCTMTETDRAGFYLLSCAGMSRTLPDLAAVALFLRHLGVPQ